MTSDDNPQEGGPYKGLSSFTEADADFFFGREDELDLVAAGLRARRLSLLYGPSGVGKSSLLRAGVVPNLRAIALRQKEEFGSPRFVPLYFGNWRDDPLASLTQEIAEMAGGFGAGSIDTSEGLVETLEAASRATGRATILVILDQFEEYFLYHGDEEGPDTFAAQFPRAVNSIGLPARFLLAMREDTLAQLDKFKNQIPVLFDSYRRVSPLGAKAAAEAIRRPLDEYNRQFSPTSPITIEDALVEAVIGQVQTGKVRAEQSGAGTVGDAAADSVEAPYLQLVMKRLWEAEAADGSHRLRLETLNRLGGADTIVRTHLDSTLDALSTDDQDLASDIFHQLVTPSGTKIVHSTHDLEGYTAHSEEQIISLLQRLEQGDTRIVRPVPPPPNTEGPARYEIFHDGLAQAVLDWRARREKVTLQKEKEHAQHEARRQKRRAGFFFGVAALALVLAVVAGLFYFSSKQESNDNQSRVLAAQAVKNLNSDPELSTLLSLSALNKSPTQQAQEALRESYESTQEMSSIDAGGQVFAVAMSEKGHIVAGIGGTSQDQFKVWNSPNSKPTRLHTQYTYATGVAFVDQARQILITGYQPGKIIASFEVFKDNGSTKPSQIVNGPSNQDNVGGYGVNGIAVDQSQNLVATVNNTGQLCVFSVAASYQGNCTGTLPITVSGAPLSGATLRNQTSQNYEQMLSVSLDAQGDKAVTVESNQTEPSFTQVVVWSIPPTTSPGEGVPTELGQLQGVLGESTDAAINPAGTQVAAEGSAGQAQLWNLSAGPPQMGPEYDTVGYSFNLTYSGDGKELLTTNDLGQSIVWNVTTGTEEVQLNCHCGTVNGDAVDPKGEFDPTGAGIVVTGSSDGNIRDRDATPREVLNSISVSPAITGPPTFVPNADQIVGTGSSHDIVITNYTTNKSAEVPGVAFAVEQGYANKPKENTLAVVDAAGGVIKYELSPNQVQPETPSVIIKDGQQVDQVAISSNGAWVALAQSSGEVTLVPLIGKGPLLGLQYNPASPGTLIQNMTFNQDGSRFMVSYNSNFAAIWNTKVVHGRGNSAEATYLGKYKDSTPDSFLLSANFSSNGRRVALVDSNGFCYVYATSAAAAKATTSQSWLSRFTAGTGQLNYVSFNSTGSEVATAGDDGVVRIWDVATGTQLSAIGPEDLPNPTAVNSVVFGPNFVVSTSNDGIVRVWSTDGTQSIGKVISAAKQRVTRGYTAQERQLYFVSG